jgi:hypothetical protein
MPFFFVLIVLLGAVVWAGWAGRVVVSADKVGIVTRRFGLPHPDPAFRQINPSGARGIQARTLLPGQHWLLPGLYSVEQVPRVRIPPGMIGLVTAGEGRPRTDGRTLGRKVECRDFQDGEAFLLGGGEQGVQVATLPGDQSYYINTRLFAVEHRPRTYVRDGTVGLVQAKAGAFRLADKRFGQHVECNSFQDGEAFITGGGQQGRQLAVLGGGAFYDINPELFEVITADNVRTSRDGLTEAHLKEISIEEGHTGVAVALDGAEPGRNASGSVAPRVEGHSSFRLPWVFLGNGGCRGVQEETLSEGTSYALNPWFVRVIVIPTRILTLNWREKDDFEADNFDKALGQISVTVQGFQLKVDMSQNLQIPESVAPTLVSQFGGVRTSGLGGLVQDRTPIQWFVRDVLGANVAAYFSEIAATSSVIEFLNKYEDTRKYLTDKVTHALEKWGVVVLETKLGSFIAEDRKLDEALKEMFYLDMESGSLLKKKEHAKIKEEIDKITILAYMRRVHPELEKEIALLGRENVAMIRTVREFANFDVPDYIGGGDISAIVQALPVNAMQELLARLRELRREQITQSVQLPELTEGADSTADAD